MGETTAIEWCHHTYNPWRGCTKVSPGCANCYAEMLSKRNPKVLGEWGPGAPRVLSADAYRELPFKWNAAAQKAGERRRVFALSLGDWLDESVPLEFLFGLLSDAVETPWLDWLLLTKRPENFAVRLEAIDRELLGGSSGWLAAWRSGVPPANIWLGVSIEDQERAELRVPVLLQIPAAVHFLSVEPLLGPIALCKGCPGCPNDCWWRPHVDRADGSRWGLDWVIVGGESGPKARPMHPDWARSLRDQCVAVGVPYFFKQWGEYHPQWEGGTKRIGKAKAGRVLDGRTWDEFPKALR